MAIYVFRIDCSHLEDDSEIDQYLEKEKDKVMDGLPDGDTIIAIRKSDWLERLL